MTSLDVATLLAGEMCPLGKPVGQPQLGGTVEAASPAPTGRKPPKIMILDDDSINVEVISKFLQSVGYEDLLTLEDPGQALETIEREQPDLLLLDILMPHANGLEILQRIRGTQRLAHLPVIVMTASGARNTRLRALDCGATDFLIKPLEPVDLVPRVRNALSLKAYEDRLEQRSRALENQVATLRAELAASRLETTHCLARMAELRDDDSGRHVVRVGRYAGLIARGLGMPDQFVALLEQAAQLHDVGKVGLADSILLKAGELDAAERQIMEKHCTDGKRILTHVADDLVQLQRSHAELGASLLQVGGSPILRLAARIALTHHERWDGSGYPLGLAGTDIPLEGRITAVADVFDALSNKRPHKPAFPLEQCFAILEQGRGTQFDPAVLDSFLSQCEGIVSVKMDYADPN
ncbi:MAG: HD domain-containing phosphohydrolase [Pirellulales bacterium]